MNIEQLETIVWWAYLSGFSYSLLIGQLLIPKFTKLTYDLVEKGFEDHYKHKWQPPVLGIIERILYILSLLMGHPQFIGFWIAIKIGIPYILWKGEEGDKDNPWKGRSLFVNSLTGNAMSILYAIAGYLIIIWLNKRDIQRAAIVAVILCLFNLILWQWLKVYKKKNEAS